MKGFIEEIFCILSILIFTGCTIPPPPCVQCAGETIQVLESNTGFQYKLGQNRSLVLLFCRKKYEDKTYCCI